MSLLSEDMILRWQRIQEAMASENLSGLVVFSNQTRPEPIQYVVNYTLLGEKAFCYLPVSGKPILFISEAWDQDRAEKESLAEDVKVLGENWAKEIAAAAGEGQIGLVGKEIMTRSDIKEIEAAIKRKTVSATKLLQNIAIIKSQYELNLIREAAGMADAGFSRALEVLKDGLTDYQLGAEIEYVMRQRGAADNFQMLAVGKYNTGMLLPCGKKIEPGDLLLFEITPANYSVTYSAQLCRTAIFQQAPSKLLLEKYDLLKEAMSNSISIIKPGVKLREVARIQNEIISQAGYAEYCRPPYMRMRGHGFGLVTRSINVDEDSELEFKAGMSLVIHPNQFFPDVGYLALGESIIVTGDGVDCLSGTESKLYGGEGA